MRDSEQVNRAIDQYGDQIRRVCFLYLKNEHDVEDVFQEVFLKYALHSSEFQEEEHEKAWLLRVAINHCKNSLKSFFRSKVTSIDDVHPTHLTLESPLDDRYRDVYDAVLSLPQHYKIAVYLFYYEGYSAVEIARILGKKDNTIYTWLARARTLLKEKLGGEFHGRQAI